MADGRGDVEVLDYEVTGCFVEDCGAHGFLPGLLAERLSPRLADWLIERQIRLWSIR
jgi:hypothetical protein